jgi:branched-chain amino acid transport system substrate-binding protein
MKTCDPAGTVVGLAIAIALLCGAPGAASAECAITVGVVMELTGPAGEYGQAAAKAVDMAFRDLNAAGGVHGCRLAADVKDSQGQAALAVDAANQLVQLARVPVIIGALVSSTTIPMLTAVTGPAKVVQVSPAASSPKLTELAREGRTNGMFFRTVTSDALQGGVAAKYAMDSGLKRLAVIYVNNDYGVGLYEEFVRRYQAMGGVIAAAARYNERQSSYAAEVTTGLAAQCDGLYLISTPVDGAAIARTWISQGGPRRFLLNDGMNSPEFIASVGAKYLGEAYGTSAGTSEGDSTRYFAEQYRPFAHLDPASPAADRAYDAAVIVGLAIAAAAAPEPAAIRAAMRQVTDPHGAVIHAGREEFARGLALAREHRPIRYEGVIGRVAFDANGDILGPFRLWRIAAGQVVTTGGMSVEDVAALHAGSSR